MVRELSVEAAPKQLTHDEVFAGVAGWDAGLPFLFNAHEILRWLFVHIEDAQLLFLLKDIR